MTNPIELEHSGDSIRINVGNLWVNVVRTDEGVVTDIFGGEESDSIASTWAAFNENEPVIDEHYGDGKDFDDNTPELGTYLDNYDPNDPFTNLDYMMDGH